MPLLFIELFYTPTQKSCTHAFQRRHTPYTYCAWYLNSFITNFLREYIVNFYPCSTQSYNVGIPQYGSRMNQQSLFEWQTVCRYLGFFQEAWNTGTIVCRVTDIILFLILCVTISFSILVYKGFSLWMIEAHFYKISYDIRRRRRRHLARTKLLRLLTTVFLN